MVKHFKYSVYTIFYVNTNILCNVYNKLRSLPCKNGAICINTTSAMFTCSCLTGYYGNVCQFYNPCEVCKFRDIKNFL